MSTKWEDVPYAYTHGWGGGDNECAVMNNVAAKEEIKLKIISNHIISLYNNVDIHKYETKQYFETL